MKKIKNGNFFRIKKEIDDTKVKDIRNYFRLKKQIDDITVKYIRNLFRLTKESEAVKKIIITDIRKSRLTSKSK